MWKESWKVCSLCSLVRQSTGFLHLHDANRWWGRAIYRPRWCSLTKDKQTNDDLELEPKQQQDLAQTKRTLNEARKKWEKGRQV